MQTLAISIYSKHTQVRNNIAEGMLEAVVRIVSGLLLYITDMMSGL